MADAGYALVAHALCDAVTDRAFATQERRALRRSPGVAPAEPDPLAQGSGFVYGAGDN